MPENVEVRNLTTSKANEGFIKKIVEIVLEKEENKGSVSVVLVGRNRIREMNKFYRGRNRVTDVLSFASRDSKSFIYPDERKELGEIFLCLREVKKRARRSGSRYELEIAKSLIHGTLHLLGYDHRKEKEAKIMELKEKEYLDEISKVLKIPQNQILNQAK